MYAQWSESEIFQLARDFYAGRLVYCPRCESRLIVHNSATLGRKTEPLIIICEECSLQGNYDTEYLEAMELTWTPQQKQAIAKTIRRGWTPECPNDEAQLKVARSSTIGPGPKYFFAFCPHCGRSFNASDDDLKRTNPVTGATYRTVKRIGQGAMGEVSLAVDAAGRQFALKAMRPGLFRDPDLVRRFRREVEILKRLDHPGVAKFLWGEIDDSGARLAMEFVEGVSFDFLLNSSSTPLATLIRGFGCLCSAVDYIHSLGIVHRDIKPANIIARDGGNLVLVDFGLSRLMLRETTALTQSGDFLGTPHYAAPEQASAKDAGPPCDIFALALIAYEIGTRRSPYASPVIFDRIGSPLRECLAVSLHPDPGQRPALAATIAEALDATYSA